MDHDVDKPNPPNVSEEDLAEILRRVSETQAKAKEEHEAFLARVLKQFEEDYTRIESAAVRKSVLNYLREQQGQAAESGSGK